MIILFKSEIVLILSKNVLEEMNLILKKHICLYVEAFQVQNIFKWFISEDNPQPFYNASARHNNIWKEQHINSLYITKTKGVPLYLLHATREHRMRSGSFSYQVYRLEALKASTLNNVHWNVTDLWVLRRIMDTSFNPSIKII